MKALTKPKIIPTVREVDDTNYARACHAIETEIKRYDIYTVNKDKVSICPMCFDTETTTHECDDGTPGAFIYMYQLEVGTLALYTRKREFLDQMINQIHYTCMSLGCKVLCGIANIKYEYSFLRRFFRDVIPGAVADDPIMLDVCKPLSLAVGNITLVDICNMTNSSLAKIGKDYCTTQKLKGDLDYEKIRNSKTPLTAKELQYCINDIVVGAEFMMGMHKKYTCEGARMPLTATAVPRGIMKKEAYRTHKGRLVHKGVLDNILSGYPDDYKTYELQMNKMFRGGYTHGNLSYAGDLLHDIKHVDYTSDYPACMLQHKYPTIFSDQMRLGSKMIYCNRLESESGLNTLLKLEKDIAFYATVTFENITAVTTHSIESEDKCIEIENPFIDNGRIVRAEKLTVMITEQDYEVYRKFYTWTNMNVTGLKVSRKMALPEYVLKALVESYVMKKWLKDQHLPYATEKSILNSCYGCCVQRIPIEDRREIYMDNEIITIKCPFPFRYLNLKDGKNVKFYNNILEELRTKYGYNDSKIEDDVKRIYEHYKMGRGGYKYLIERDNNIATCIKDYLQQQAYLESLLGVHGRSIMLSCYWGMWITAYARRRLLDMVFDLENWAIHNNRMPIVVYCDTDSMFLNSCQDDECEAYVDSVIKAYNDKTRDYNMKNLSKYTALIEDTSVTDKDTLLSDIGTFDYEPTASHFKQLGAKRYVQRYMPKGTNEYIIESTIAGLSKADFSRKINQIEGSIEDKFAVFTNGMVVEGFETSKLRPVYRNTPYKATVTDDYGNTEVMEENSGQVLMKVDFRMRLVGAIAEHCAARIG